MQEVEKVAKFFKSKYSHDLSEKELSVKGWNWGTAKFAGSILSFDVNNLTAFEIPLSNVSQCTTGKNEVTVEFHQVSYTPFVQCLTVYIPVKSLCYNTFCYSLFRMTKLQ